MSNELVVQHRSGLAIDSEQDFWDDKQLAALRQIGVDRASNGDLAVFMHVCQRTGLDPFARQIYMILRDGKQTIQTGIDGMRLVARRAVDRTGESLAISAPEWCGYDGQWHDVWLSEDAPAAARVVVTRGTGQFAAVALLREYSTGKATWRSRPAGMLAKCAEALALRKSCPQDLSGIYSEEELQRDERPPRQGGGLAAALADDDSPAAAGVEATGGEPATSPSESPLLNTSGKLARRMFKVLGDAGITGRAERLAKVSEILGRDIGSSSEMTDADAERVIAAFPPGGDADDDWAAAVEGQ